jgi:hypothetical protein
MHLHKITIAITRQMAMKKAKERKVSLSFTTQNDGTQSVFFTVFWQPFDVSNERNKYLCFYEFQSDNEHKEKIQKIYQYLQGEINEDQLFFNKK